MIIMTRLPPCLSWCSEPSSACSRKPPPFLTRSRNLRYTPARDFKCPSTTVLWPNYNSSASDDLATSTINALSPNQLGPCLILASRHTMCDIVHRDTVDARQPTERLILCQLARKIYILKSVDAVNLKSAAASCALCCSQNLTLAQKVMECNLNLSI